MWPIFPERYPIEAISVTPSYRDPLVLLGVILVGIVGFLVTRLGRKGTAHTLGLVTLRPRAIVTMGDYHVPTMQYLLGVVFAVMQVALFLLLVVGLAEGGGDHFWVYFGEISALVTLFFLLRYCLMAWVGFTFAERSQTRLWLVNVVLLFILFGLSLALPLALALILPDYTWWFVALGGVLYLLYRIIFVLRGVSVLSKLSKAPLLIIWYLCTCELAPLYLAFSIAMNR